MYNNKESKPEKEDHKILSLTSMRSKEERDADTQPSPIHADRGCVSIIIRVEVIKTVYQDMFSLRHSSTVFRDRRFLF